MAEWVKQRRFLSIQDVCERFNISEPTARRDLRVLESQRAITRTFGGAIGDFDQTFESFSQRTEVAHEAKKRLAENAVDRIEDGMCLFLDGGTTLFYTARELGRRSFKDLTVVTSNLAAAEALVQSSDIKTILTGGEFIGRQSVLVGKIATHGLKPFHFDYAFLSAVGINQKGVWNTRGHVVEIQKEVYGRTDQPIFLLDRTKFGKEGDEFVLPIERVAHCITDASGPDFKKAGIQGDPSRFTRVRP